jgi:hypothetical protein
MRVVEDITFFVTFSRGHEIKPECTAEILKKIKEVHAKTTAKQGVRGQLDKP